MNTIIRYIFSALIVVFSAFNLNAISYYDFDDKGLCFNILSENTVEVTPKRANCPTSILCDWRCKNS